MALTVSGPGGSNTQTRTGYIVVTATSAPLVAAFEADKTTGTAPLTVRFTDRSSGSVTGRLWAFGDGQSSTEQNPEHTYVAAGLYTASLTVNGAGATSSKWEIFIDVKAAGPGEPASTRWARSSPSPPTT